MKKTPEPKMLSALEVANYVVCPESWRLKRMRLGRRKSSGREFEAKQLRNQWAEKQELATTLRRYAKIAYALMVLIVIVIFLFEKELRQNIRES
ncbi:MAG: hypothetical protein IT290_00830, partial [Deltaproteobacteria bacterium]|nr:hypothetical protein [Deltaproteobacteria bacterium]